MTIRFKLTFLITMTVVIAVALSLGLTVISVRKQFEMRFYKNTKAMLDSAIIDIKGDFIRGFIYAQNWAEDTELIKWLDSDTQDEKVKEAVMEKFKKLAAKSGIISVFIASDAAQTNYMSDSKQIIQVGKLSPHNTSDTWFYTTLKLKNKVTFFINKNKETGLTGLWINAQVFGAEHKITGIAGIGLSLDTSVQSLKNAVPSKNSTLYLVDESGKIIISSKDDVFGKNLHEYLSSELETIDNLSTIKMWKDNAGEKMICAEKAASEEFPYKLVLIAPVSEFLPSFFAIAKDSIIVLIVMVVLAGTAVTFGVRRISKRILRIGEFMQILAQGDLTVNIVTRKDELGKIGVYVNHTASTMRTLFMQIKNETVNMTTIGSELVVEMQKAGAAIHQITDNIKDLHREADTQVKSVLATGNIIEHIIRSIRTLNSSIEVQASSISTASTAIEQMIDSIHRVAQSVGNAETSIASLMSVTQDGKNTLLEANSISQKIAEQSGDLIEASNVIENIAS